MFRAIVFDQIEVQWLLFQDPVELLVAHETTEVKDVLARVDEVRQQGKNVVGFVAYEAASAFDSSLTHQPNLDFPLAMFGVFHEGTSVELEGGVGGIQLNASISPESHAEAVDRIKDYLSAGDTYQVNLTHQLRGQLDIDPLACFAELMRRQVTPYGVFIETEELAICSASPELFFAAKDGRIVTAPMKGTRPRGSTADLDEQQKQDLKCSPKDRAENLMIVDMIRNDLGKIADAGEVRVDQLFAVEGYSTVWQQVSTVSAVSGVGLADAFKALFPCASVTGAPKCRTMQIIKELEREPRGLYTGAVGWVRPSESNRDLDATFNVAIRTLTIDKQSRSASYGVGGGIVWDSDPQEEWLETQVKAQILQETPDFSLLETMRYEPGQGIQRVELHLTRLARSARQLGFTVDLSPIRRCLDDFVTDELRRVRLLVDRCGAFRVESYSFSDDAANSKAMVKLGLAKEPVSSIDTLLRHKTTRRTVYEHAIATRDEGVDDVVLFNERGELTETTICNLFLEIEGSLVTPPVASGLLPGVLREVLIREGTVAEQVLAIEDLRRADRILIGNSLRGLRDAKVLGL